MRKPDFELGNGDVRLFLGDCLSILPEFPDGCVDAVVTDPPFGVEGGAGHDAIYRPRPLKYGSDEIDTEEYVKRVCVPMIEICRKLSPIVVLTPGVRCCWFYPRPDDMGCFWCPAAARRGPWGFATFSPILYYGKDFRAGRGSTPTGTTLNERAPNNGHPCPKPIAAWTWLVEKATPVGAVVCDPMMGSGTTGVAAIKLGRKFWGIELEPKYFDIAVKRIKDTYTGGPLLEAAERQAGLF